MDGRVSENANHIPFALICNSTPKTVEHILLLCEWTSDVWFGSSLSLLLDKAQIITFDHYWAKISSDKNLNIDQKHYVQVEVFHACKEHCHVKSFFEGGTTLQSYLVDRSPVLGWILPHANKIKINTYSPFDPLTKEAGIRIIIRNTCRRVVNGTTCFVQTNSTFGAEALALRKGLVMAAIMDQTLIELESNCKESVLVVQS
ncbi:reverse transcriptase [Quillaja saponaria]|uniref:Reverse transcriptase n=1 Tax=Quillaja saponaria TaxID=32244 RepID=A0AAD7L135_QUISA|nr:reverse transcriptase [Quillaja saponaria]